MLARSISIKASQHASRLNRLGLFVAIPQQRRSFLTRSRLPPPPKFFKDGRSNEEIPSFLRSLHAELGSGLAIQCASVLFDRGVIKGTKRLDQLLEDRLLNLLRNHKNDPKFLTILEMIIVKYEQMFNIVREDLMHRYECGLAHSIDYFGFRYAVLKKCEFSSGQFDFNKLPDMLQAQLDTTDLSQQTTEVKGAIDGAIDSCYSSLTDRICKAFELRF